METPGSVLSYTSLPTVFESADEITLCITRTGKIIAANARAPEILECGERELSGRNFFDDFVPEDVREQVKKEFRDGLASGDHRSFRQEYPILTAGGKIIPAEFRNIAARDEDGIVMCILVSGHASGKTTEKKSDRLEICGCPYDNPLHCAITIRSDPLSIIAADGDTESILGMEKPRLLELTDGEVGKIFEPESWNDIRTRLDTIGSGEERASMEYTIQRPDGVKVHVLAALCRIDIDGIPSLQLFLTDVTGMKNELETTKKSEKRYRILVENSTDGIIIHNNGIIVYANEAAASMTGYSRAELTGHEILNLVTPEHLDTVRRNMRERYEGGDVPVIYDVELMGKNGKRMPIEVNVTPIPLEGEGAFMVFARDLTTRKRLEDRLRQAQMMDAVGRLAGGMAHDFNNILQVINGYVELAGASLEEGHPVLEMLAQVSEAGKRAVELVKELLLFSRDNVMKLQITELDTLVSDNMGLMERALGEGVRILFRSSGKPVYVNVDPGMMGQVFLNLCLNARDALKGRGTVIIETKKVRLDADFCSMYPQARPGEFGMFSITDNGEGMDDATLARVFEPFFSTKDITEGAGLGLSTVYGIVTQHEGIVTADGSPGKGAKFTIYLPVTDGPPKDTEPVAVRKPLGGRSLSIILAEDDENVRNLVCEVLMDQGHDVFTATSGEGAVILLSDSPDSVDLVILDVAMPGMGGISAAEKIREIRPDMLLIFCSGYDMDEKAEFLSRFGEKCRFLGKPYSMDELLDTISELV